jgi:hypothetical protein
MRILGGSGSHIEDGRRSGDRGHPAATLPSTPISEQHARPVDRGPIGTCIEQSLFGARQTGGMRKR